jgi:hypothetical protein
MSIESVRKFVNSKKVIEESEIFQGVNVNRLRPGLPAWPATKAQDRVTLLKNFENNSWKTNAQTAALYVPYFRQGQKPTRGSTPSGKIMFMKMGNGGRPVPASIDAALVDVFIAYLKELIGRDAGVEGDTLGGSTAENPYKAAQAAEEDPMAPKTAFDAALGAIQNLWEPFMVDPEDMEVYKRTCDKVVPGIEVSKLVDLITGDPGMSSASTNILEFKRSLRDGANPTLSPLVQQELLEAHLKLIGLVREIQVDEKGQKYVDSKSLTPEIKQLLTCITARDRGFAENATGSSKGIYFGRRNGDFTAMPELYDALLKFDGKQANAQYGISFGEYTQPLCEALLKVVEKKVDGSYSKPLLQRSFAQDGNALNRKLAVVNEKIMAALFNAAFAKAAENQDELAAATEELENYIKGVFDFADTIKNQLPTAGILSDEDPFETISLIQEGLTGTELDNPVIAHAQYLNRNVNLMLSHLKKAGVDPANLSAEHTGGTSTANKKDDFVINFSNPEDSMKFNSYLKDNFGLDFDGENIPVSLKTYSSNARLDMGGTNISVSYNPALYLDSQHKTPEAQRKHDEREQMLEYMSSKIENKQFKSAAKKGSEINSYITGMVENVFKPISHLNPKTSNQLSYESFKTRIERMVGPDIDMKQEWNEIEKKVNAIKFSSDYNKIEQTKQSLFRFVRAVMVQKDKSLLKSFAYSDLLAGSMTLENELMWSITPQESVMTTNHTIMKSLIDDCDVEMAGSDAFNQIQFIDRNSKKKVGYIDVSAKGDDADRRVRIGLRLEKDFLEKDGISIREQSKLTKVKEGTIRKIEKFIKLIEEASIN